MSFEARIEHLSRELENCEDDRQAIQLLRELQQAIHERIEQIRTDVNGLPLVAGRPDSKSKAARVQCPELISGH